MEAFASYLLKSVIWTAGFTVVFILFLRNERFFFLNRIYLIVGILTSFFFPLVSVHYTVVLPVFRNFQSDSAVVTEVQKAGSSVMPDLRIILTLLYVSGVLLVLTLILKQARAVVRAIKKSEIISLSQVKLIKTPDYTSAFSFFSYVFVNPSITDIETEEIMNHELVHIRQKHWFDLLLVELLCMLQWFNPLVWIYVRFMRQNHEYLADEVALQRTSNPAIYRAVLLNQIVGAPVVSLTNSFNYSPNKKRFIMMKNIISSPYRKMKILLILPVFAIVLYAFAKPEYKYKFVDTGSGNYIQSASVLQHEVKGTVVQQDGEPLPGASIVVQGTFLGASADAKGYFKIDNMPDDKLLIVSFVGFKSKILKPVFTSDMTIQMTRDTVLLANDPLVVVDGVITNIDIDKIDPATIESVNVLKDKSATNKPATDKYGEKGKNGVVEVLTKDYMGKVLVVIDGVLHEKDGMSKIQMEDIKTMNVLAVKPAMEKYGEKGKNGAMEITLYKSSDEKPDIRIVSKQPGDPKTGKEPLDVVQAVSKPDTDKFVVVEEMPSFPGGKNAMQAWITDNLQYPAAAAKNKITGKVYVSFTVSKTGKVKNVVVSKSASPLLNAEAIRIISSMPDWKPATQAGKTVDVQYKVPVEFKLK
jgi:TonB family protein